MCGARDIGAAMIETGEDLRAAREKLGWSVVVMARALRLAGDRDQAAKRLIENLRLNWPLRHRSPSSPAPSPIKGEGRV